MNPDYALKNHAMLEEAGPETQKRFEKRVGHKKGNLGGTETPLGHTYSIGLELLAAENRNAEPDVTRFLEYMNKNKEGLHSPITLHTPTYSYDMLKIALSYFGKKGLSEKGKDTIVREVLGPDGFY